MKYLVVDFGQRQQGTILTCGQVGGAHVRRAAARRSERQLLQRKGEEI